MSQIHPLVRPALKGIVYFGVVCAALVALWLYMPKGEVNWYPSLWMRLAAVSPLFFSTQLGRAVFAVLKRRMDGRERIVFAGSFCLGVGCLAVLAEAGCGLRQLWRSRRAQLFRYSVSAVLFTLLLADLRRHRLCELGRIGCGLCRAHVGADPGAEYGAPKPHQERA